MPARIMRLLQVEDDPNEVYFLDWVVRRWNVPMVMHVTSTGPAALHYLETETAAAGCPDMLLLDIHMPQMTGFDVLQKLKERPEWSQLPVVMFSNSNQPADIQRARELGAQSYVVKPDDPATLAAILKSLHTQWEQSASFHVWPDHAPNENRAA